MTIPLSAFLTFSRRNLRCYPRSASFWVPLLDVRAIHHQETADGLLLNPIFRWAFLGRVDRLEALERELVSLEAAVGSAQVQTFGEQLREDLAGHVVENAAHNRLLASRAEVRAILRFSDEGMRISVVPREHGERTPDLRGTSKAGLISEIEAKYIRPPDKLGEYLLRWWQAQKEVAGEIPQGLVPHVKFEWEPVESKDELSAGEITLLNNFFSEALKQPSRESELRSGRIRVSYLPRTSPPASMVPLPAKATQSEAAREPLFDKIRRILCDAQKQVTGKKGAERVVFLLLNLSPNASNLSATV